MTATVHPHPARFRAPPPILPSVPGDDEHGRWPVQADALAHCRALLSRHGGFLPSPPGCEDAVRWVDVPPAYERFCRHHFASVRRLHPQLSWEDARSAYALALAAHAVLCDGLDEASEQQLAEHWPSLRGRSTLDWSRAGSLLADGCRALGRLDPLAMHR